MKSGPAFNPFKQLSIPEYVVKRDCEDDQNSKQGTRKSSGFQGCENEFEFD